MWFLSCSYTDIKTIAFQVVQGLSFLNAHGIVNRNLSPVNIVFTPKVRIFTIHGHGQMSFWFPGNGFVLGSQYCYITDAQNSSPFQSHYSDSWQFALFIYTP